MMSQDNRIIISALDEQCALEGRLRITERECDALTDCLAKMGSAVRAAVRELDDLVQHQFSTYDQDGGYGPVWYPALRNTDHAAARLRALRDALSAVCGAPTPGRIGGLVK